MRVRMTREVHKLLQERRQQVQEQLGQMNQLLSMPANGIVHVSALLLTPELEEQLTRYAITGDQEVELSPRVGLHIRAKRASE